MARASRGSGGRRGGTGKNKLLLFGFEEMIATLAKLPRDIRGKALPIMRAHADRAATEVKAAYSEGPTGNLRKGVIVGARQSRRLLGLAVTVSTTAPHAHLWEFGTVKQRARHTFIPITDRHKRAATAEIAAMVEAEGIDVKGVRD